MVFTRVLCRAGAQCRTSIRRCWARGLSAGGDAGPQVTADGIGVSVLRPMVVETNLGQPERTEARLARVLNGRPVHSLQDETTWASTVILFQLTADVILAKSPLRPSACGLRAFRSAAGSALTAPDEQAAEGWRHASIFLKASMSGWCVMSACRRASHLSCQHRYEGRTTDELVRQLIDNEVLADVSEILD